MVQPLGINAVMNAVIETTYGSTPASGWLKLPFTNHSMGEVQPLIEDDQLGFGRSSLDPTYDVVTNDGDITVPVDLRGFGFWLKMAFGAPTTTLGAMDSISGAQLYQHNFASGGTLPSASVEFGNPDMPIFSTHYGLLLNQMKIDLARGGLLQAVLSLIGQGEADPATTSAATSPTLRRGPRFGQATGSILVDGVVAGNINKASFSFSNNLDKREVIRSDGRIGGVNPGVAMSMGSLGTLFTDRTLLDKATSKTPVALNFTWSQPGGSALGVYVSRVFLPKPKRPIPGPKGIMADFDWQGSGSLLFQLVNDVTSYA